MSEFRSEWGIHVVLTYVKQIIFYTVRLFFNLNSAQLTFICTNYNGFYGMLKLLSMFEHLWK